MTRCGLRMDVTGFQNRKQITLDIQEIVAKNKQHYDAEAVPPPDIVIASM